jgi:deoxycytidylate deaminase
MSCAKKKVICLLVTEDHSIFVCSNDCQNPQETCPREPGEGYEKCKSICQQPHHAEVDAIMKAGDKARGAMAFITHHRVCCDCQKSLEEAGVKSVSLV